MRLMATSSHYHSRASTQASHYQALASNHDNGLYASPATSWQSQNSLSQAPCPSALLQRFSSSARHLFADQNFNYGGSSDYVNHPPHPGPPWTATLFRHGPQEWSDTLSDGNVASRSIAYGNVEHGASAPLASLGLARQHQHQQHQRQHQPTSDTAHIVLLNTSGNAYRPAPRQSQHEILPELSAPPHAPPVRPRTQKSAPVAQLLNYPNSELHSNHLHIPSQAPVSWPAGSSSDVPQSSPPQHPSHSGNALSSTMILSSQGNFSSPAWDVLNQEGGLSSSSAYARQLDVDAVWSPVPTQPANEGYISHHVDPNRLPSAVAASQASRRPPAKKNRAKVPASFVPRQKKMKTSTRKGPLGEANRRKTHQMRKEKNVCLRCKFYKNGCDDGDPCQKCLKVEGSARSFGLGCIRARLEDASLVRHCNGRCNQEEGEFLSYDWIQGSDIGEMDIIWNLPGQGPISWSEPIRVEFRAYHPTRPGLDTYTSVWTNTNGEVNAVEQPPYAIYDHARLLPDHERYFSKYQPGIEEWIFARVQHDPIAFLTYQEVVRMRSKSTPGANNLLDLVMRIQGVSIVSQGYGTVWSNNIPGIREYDYRQMGRSIYEAYDRNSRDRPLPGAIKDQMDVAALKYLRKLEGLCMKALAARFYKSGIKPWYELFLAFFVLFWNLEYIRRGAQKYIISKNGTEIQSQVSNVVSQQIQKWEWGFQVLMQHWIAVLRGFSPFKLARENPEELRENGHLDAEGFQYVIKVASILERRGPDQYSVPYVGDTSIHSSVSSEWLMALVKQAGA